MNDIERKKKAIIALKDVDCKVLRVIVPGLCDGWQLHKEIAVAWAMGAKIQYKKSGVKWINWPYPSFNENGEYRIEPETITINGREINAPWRTRNRGEFYWWVTLSGDLIESKFILDGEVEPYILNRGVCWKTKEDAEAYRDAIDSFTRME